MSGAARPAVEIRGLEIRYGEVAAVDGVDLEIPRGGLTVLVGPSGCGKTSLLRAIAGFEAPRRGSVRISGELVAGPGRWTAPEKRRVGMVSQQGALFPHMTVWRNVVYGLKGHRHRDRRAGEILELVGMSAHRERYPDELSGGEQQRVALARALAPRPSIVLLDEPFASLDAVLRRRLRGEVRSILRRAGATAVLVTHDQEEAFAVADTVAVMMRGRLLQTGAPDDVYRRPASPDVARIVGDGQLVACRVEAGRAHSLLGAAACDGPDGHGLLLVRPEDLQVAPRAAAGEGRSRHLLDGRVARRQFLGHDLIDEVELAGGELLRVRVLAPDRVGVGEPVRVTLRRGTYRVFPAAGQRAPRFAVAPLASP